MAAMATLAQPLAGTATTVCSSHSFNNHTGNKQVTVKGSFAAGRTQSVQQQQQQQQQQHQQSASKVVRFVVRAAEEDGTFPAEGAEGNSVVAEVAMLAEEPDTDGLGNDAASASASASTSNKVRKASPLQKGGTLDGTQAEGKDPAAATLGKTSPLAAMAEGKFNDPRWRAGTWDISQFTKDGKTNWDAVIDAEVVRRKWLEDNPEASSNEEPVVFETSTVPWWAWVKRFHLPEAELLNGRAAMMGYAAGYLVDGATGIGLVDQQNSFFGKLLLFITVVGVLAIRKNSDVDNLRNLAQESTYYDKQWQATWKDVEDRNKTDSR